MSQGVEKTGVGSGRPQGAISVDVEDWFHILDSPAAPAIQQWSSLESRIEANVDRLLELFHGHAIRATFFWLGWEAERHKALVLRCHQAGHEIASHGYGHVLAYQVGSDRFREDVVRGKGIIEDMLGRPVLGFRAAGFSATADSMWVFDVIKEAGHEYDSSVFPAARQHGGMPASPLGPHLIQTQAGPLVECPMSAVEVLGQRIPLFGGGYLRVTPHWLIRWGLRRLHGCGQPLIVYVHPREIDPDHPRLPLSLIRRFKCYVNLKSTMPKIEWLCGACTCCTVGELARRAASTSKGA